MLTVLGIGTVGSVVAQTDSNSALQQIEGVRGGRHWIDQPTAPPRSPQESLKAFRIEPGYRLELVAAEPLIQDPVEIAFDEQGRLFAVEYGDYPVGPADGEPPLSRIVMLEDSDGDGQLDRRHVFADQLHFAHSLMPWKGGLLVGAHSELLHLRDTDGDHVADQRTVVFSGFTPAHPQMQIGCPRWGLDNRVYCTYGPGNVTRPENPDQKLAVRGRDFVFDPQTMEHYADSGLGQYGNTIDRWGNRFFCTNRDPIISSLLPPDLVSRNPWAVVPRVQYSVGKSGADTRVYPLVEMKSNYLAHAGTHTAACGVTAYTGGLGSESLQDSVFVCEPIGHLVTRSVVADDGARLRATRARDKADFLASTDTWFRPVSLTTGPDGALYLADMYRLWVEHPKFLPPEIAERIDWRAGEDRGRIYRITAENAQSVPFAPPATTADCVALLQHGNGWCRFLGQRLLVERQDVTAAAAVREILNEATQPTARLHALWTLDGLRQLTNADLEAALEDHDHHVRRDAIRLASERIVESDDLLAAVIACGDDTSGLVRFQTAVALGNSSAEAATRQLIRLALQDGTDAWFARGLLTSVGRRSAAVLEGLLSNSEFVASGSHSKIDLVRQLASVCGARGDQRELKQLLLLATAESPAGLWWRAAVTSGLGTGLVRHRGDLGRTSLPALLQSPPEELAAAAQRLSQQLSGYQQRCLDEQLPVPDRVAAVELLAYQPFAEVSSVLDELLTGGQPLELQTAAIRALSGKGVSAAEIVIERWPEIGPSVRPQALGILLRRPESTRMALQAMADGQVNASALSVDQRVRLLKHSNAELKQLAEQLLGGAVSENRREVAQEYEQALKLSASAAAGRRVFQRVCSRCHRVDDLGHRAGPDISDVRNRSRSAILYDILDPNAKVEPQYTSYTVVTVDGLTYSGLMASDTAETVVLRMPEGKEQAIGRGQIDEIRASVVSLMPEGIEKDVTIQQMADLLEFLKNRQAAAETGSSTGAAQP